MRARRFLVTLAAAGILAGSAGPLAVLAADDAAAPMDHAALAASYEKEAKDARQMAAQHQTMLNRYKNAPSIPKGSALPKEAMVEHCQKLMDAYGQAAAQADSLAQAHKAAAK